MTKTVSIRNLRRGSIFTLGGEKHRLLYVNDCRALIEKASREPVMVRKLNKKTGLVEEVEFEARNGTWNICPDTIVEIERRIHG